MTLVERLLNHKEFFSTDGFRWYQSSDPDKDCQEAAARIRQLEEELFDLHEWKEQHDCRTNLTVKLY